jgi:hypothetical protein
MESPESLEVGNHLEAGGVVAELTLFVDLFAIRRRFSEDAPESDSSASSRAEMKGEHSAW